MTDIIDTTQKPVPDLLTTPTAGAEEEEVETDDEEGEEEETPQEGDILSPGQHLIEIATIIPCKQDVLLAGLTQIGFGAIRMDQSYPRSSTPFAVREHRFVADLKRAVMIHQKGALRWTFARPLSIDVGRDMRNYRFKLEAFELERHVQYEALFISRDRTQATREIVEDNLNKMGFAPIVLTALHRDVRLEKRPKVSVTIWAGLLEWDAAASVVTEDDPFYFEDLVQV